MSLDPFVGSSSEATGVTPRPPARTLPLLPPTLGLCIFSRRSPCTSAHLWLHDVTESFSAQTIQRQAQVAARSDRRFKAERNFRGNKRAFTEGGSISTSNSTLPPAALSRRAVSK